MTCFMDILTPEDSEYKKFMYQIAPKIKKSSHCERCLRAEPPEVEPIDCPYLIEAGIFDKNVVFFNDDERGI